MLPLHSQFSNELALNGIWCNGNTTDSGPVIPGSNPGIPTLREIESSISFLFLCISFFHYIR